MRICEAKTRILRASFRLKTDAMFIEFQPAMRRVNGFPPNRGESNSVQGAGVKKTPHQRRVRRAFPMAAQAESTSWNPHSDWDVVSGWRLKRKLHPRISAQNGMHFPDGLLAESSSRNPRSERDALSQWRSKRKAHPGIILQTGTRLPPHPLNPKTRAPNITKLGRRKPKRNRRRST